MHPLSWLTAYWHGDTLYPLYLSTCWRDKGVVFVQMTFSPSCHFPHRLEGRSLCHLWGPHIYPKGRMACLNWNSVSAQFYLALVLPIWKSVETYNTVPNNNNYLSPPHIFITIVICDFLSWTYQARAEESGVCPNDILSILPFPPSGESFTIWPMRPISFVASMLINSCAGGHW